MKDKKLRVAGIVENSITNGEGIRKVIFFQGCNHKCPGCFNEHTWDMNGGIEYTVDELFDEIIKDKDSIDGVTFSGGDPFEQAPLLSKLAKRLKSEGVNIWCYTGYTINFIIEVVYLKRYDKSGWDELINNIDYLVEGPFMEDKVSNKIKFRGSSNQSIIDVQGLLKSGKITFYKEN